MLIIYNYKIGVNENEKKKWLKIVTHTTYKIIFLSNSITITINIFSSNLNNFKHQISVRILTIIWFDSYIAL